MFQTGPQPTDVRVLRWSSGAGGLSYVDNRGERDHVFPPSHDFEWTGTTRDDHVLGRHPHISIEGEVFVETVGGTLTVKVENNTESGEGIYSEPVAEPLQSLSDPTSYSRRALSAADACVQGERWRHPGLNPGRAGDPAGGIGLACQRLPGTTAYLPRGYYLATDVSKT